MGIFLFFWWASIVKDVLKINELMLGPAKHCKVYQKVVPWSSHIDSKIVLIQIFILKICSRNDIEQGGESFSLGTTKDIQDSSCSHCVKLFDHFPLHFWSCLVKSYEFLVGLLFSDSLPILKDLPQKFPQKC